MGGVYGGIWDGFVGSKGLILSEVIIHMYEVLKEYIKYLFLNIIGLFSRNDII